MRLVIICFYVFLNFSSAYADWALRSDKFHIIWSNNNRNSSLSEIRLDKEINTLGLQDIKIKIKSNELAKKLNDLLSDEGFEPLHIRLVHPVIVVSPSRDNKIFYDLLDILNSFPNSGLANDIETMKSHKAITVY